MLDVEEEFEAEADIVVQRAIASAGNHFSRFDRVRTGWFDSFSEFVHVGSVSGHTSKRERTLGLLRAAVTQSRTPR